MYEERNNLRNSADSLNIRSSKDYVKLNKSI